MKKKKNFYHEPLSKKTFFWVLAILVVSIAAFSPILQNAFLNWDDIDYITNNPTIQSLDFTHLKDIFTSHPLKTYVPLTTLSFAFEYLFFQFNPYFYHLDNLLLHLSIAWLIYLFLRKLSLSVRTAGLAALLFAVHPMHVEAVAWVSARKDVLYAFFYMLALLNYCLYLEKRQSIHYWLSFFCGLLSMLSKGMALSLPFILLLCDWLYKRKDSKIMFFDKLPFFIYILPLAWANYAPNTSVMTMNKDFGEAVLIFIWSLTFYIKKFIFPFHLTPLYITPEPIHILSSVYLSSVIILIICLIAIYRYRTYQWLIFAFVFYFCSIFFLLRFDRLYNLSVVADRYMYLPMLGFCALIGIFCDKLLSWIEDHKPQWRSFIAVLLACALTVLSIKTNLQCRIWKNNLILWNRVIAGNQTLSVAYLNRGAAYKELNQIQESINDLKQSIKLLPSFGAHYNLANIYTNEKEYALAIENYSAAIQLDPQHALAYNNRGVVNSTQKNYAEAVKDFNKAIEIDPTLLDPYYNQAVCYFLLNNTDAALASYNQVIHLRPDFWQAYANRAVIYTKHRQLNLALQDYDYFIRNNPQSASTYDARSRVYADLKQFDHAFNDALKAKQLGYPVDEKYLEELTQLK